MLAAAWLVKGSACGWGLLRSISPGRSVRASVARLGGDARSSGDDPRAAPAASSSNALAVAAPAPPPSSSPRVERRRLLLLLRARPPVSEQPVASAWGSSFACSRRGPGGQPLRTRTSYDGAPRQPAGSSEQRPGGANSCGYAELATEDHWNCLLVKICILSNPFHFCWVVGLMWMYLVKYENPWTIPNLLSMVRIGLAPVLGYLIVEEDFNIALGVFALAGITDLLDGFIARNWANQKSALGSALDPLADKILISILYISLTYANLIPVPLTSLIILRDIALIVAVFYVRYKTLPPPKTLSRYFNPCHATAQLKPTFISKMNTVVQLVLVAASLAAPVFKYVDSVYLQTLWCITAFTTTTSAYSYYHYGRKTVQVLNNK